MERREKRVVPPEIPNPLLRKIEFENARKCIFGTDFIPNTKVERWTVACPFLGQRPKCTFRLGSFLFELNDRFVYLKAYNNIPVSSSHDEYICSIGTSSLACNFSVLDMPDFTDAVDSNNGNNEGQVAWRINEDNGALEYTFEYLNNIQNLLKHDSVPGIVGGNTAKDLAFSPDGNEIGHLERMVKEVENLSPPLRVEFYHEEHIISSDNRSFVLTLDTSKINTLIKDTKQNVTYAWFSEYYHEDGRDGAWYVCKGTGIAHPSQMVRDKIFPSDDPNPSRLCVYGKDNDYIWYESDVKILCLAFETLMHVLTGPDPRKEGERLEPPPKEESAPIAKRFVFEEAQFGHSRLTLLSGYERYDEYGRLNLSFFLAKRKTLDASIVVNAIEHFITLASGVSGFYYSNSKRYRQDRYLKFIQGTWDQNVGKHPTDGGEEEKEEMANDDNILRATTIPPYTSVEYKKALAELNEYVGSCIACGDADAASLCGNCRKVRYCGQECQRVHWSEHKMECKEK